MKTFIDKDGYMGKEIRFSKEAREKILNGMNILANAVKATLGPKGRNVVIDKGGFETPLVTNDGVTIAKEIILDDILENTGAKLIYEVANKTNDVAGDGTTTATVLAQSMIELGIKMVEKGSNPVFLKEGILLASYEVEKKLTAKSKKIETLQEVENIATISSADREIGKIIAKAIDAIGENGVINVDESTSFETQLEIVEGLKFDRGYVSPYLVTNRDKMEVVLENAYILITDTKINTIQEILPILEESMKTNKPLLIIADDYESEVISTIIVNKLRGNLNIVAVKAPGFGDYQKEQLQDLAILTKGTYCSKDLNSILNELKFSELGYAAKVIVTKDSTTIICDTRENLELSDRIIEIKKQIERSKNEWEVNRCYERLSKLSNGVAVIKVGAATETELKHKKLKIEDAVNATKAAVSEGIVIGGGAVLVEIYNELKISLIHENVDIQRGINVVLESILTPMYWICENAGYDGEKIVSEQKTANKHIGFDAKEGKWVNMLEAGIIDPTKVTKNAILNSASIASLFITTEALVVNKEEERKLPNISSIY